eukprot:GHVU01137505.1.p1 GENE.GHVU01137505.1~~GHVU01137505.1.p1  ORF type:complete len:324 (+),score=29.77 GHVU01137505.1:199-1170(+)
MVFENSPCRRVRPCYGSRRLLQRAALSRVFAVMVMMAVMTTMTSVCNAAAYNGQEYEDVNMKTAAVLNETGSGCTGFTFGPLCKQDAPCVIYSAAAVDPDNEPLCNKLYYFVTARPRENKNSKNCGDDGCDAFFAAGYGALLKQNTGLTAAEFGSLFLHRNLCREWCADAKTSSTGLCVADKRQCESGKGFSILTVANLPIGFSMETKRFEVSRNSGFNATCPLCTTATCNSGGGDANAEYCRSHEDCQSACNWAKYFSCAQHLSASADGKDLYFCVRDKIQESQCSMADVDAAQCGGAIATRGGGVGLFIAAVAALVSSLHH